MAEQYGLRTKDASGVMTLDTSITSVRVVKMFTVTGSGEYNQYFAIPEIRANSFVVVDALYDSGGNTWTPQAFWTDGQLHLRAAGSMTWQVMILSQGNDPFASTGSYGIRTLNNSVRTQIDSVNRVLGVKYSGAFEFGMYWRPGMQAQVSPGFYYQFPTPITTYERPMVFLNAVNYMMVSGFYVSGSPGNWTGWGIGHAGVYYRSHGLEVSDYMQMRWFAATYETDVSAAGAYGASVKDASGKRIFSSTVNLASLTSQPANNSFYNDNEPIVSGSNYAASARMPWTGSFNDYVLANGLFAPTNIVQTTNPIKANFGGFLPSNRSILKMYTDNFTSSPTNVIGASGRTLFAARPVRPI